jgi:hypothetical protein
MFDERIFTKKKKKIILNNKFIIDDWKKTRIQEEYFIKKENIFKGFKSRKEYNTIKKIINKECIYTDPFHSETFYPFICGLKKVNITVTIKKYLDVIKYKNSFYSYNKDIFTFEYETNSFWAFLKYSSSMQGEHSDAYNIKKIKSVVKNG